MRESLVESHLGRQVRARGGEVRKVQWVGRRGAPDRLVLLLDRPPTFIELKRPGLTAEDHQAREHRKLMKYGVRVIVLDTKQKIDYWLETGEVLDG